MNGTQNGRLQRLEQLTGKGKVQYPAYVCLAEGEDPEQALAGLPRWIKVYVGFCPDDWEAASERTKA